MKTIHYFFFFSWFIFAVSCSTQNNSKEESTPPSELPTTPCETIQPTWDGNRPNDSYKFPIIPGMDEWAGFESGQEMYDACQVQKDILEKMTTQAVIQAILEHPLSSEVFVVGDCYQSYFERFWMDFKNHAYMDLTKRKDAGTALLDRLILTDPLTGIFSKPAFESQMLEILFSQTVFLSQLNVCEMKNVVEFSIRNDDLRKFDVDFTKDSDYGFSIGKITSSLLIGRTLVAAGYTPFVEAVNGSDDLKGFIEGWQQGTFNESTGKPFCFVYPSHPNIPQQIFDFGKKYLTGK